MTGGRTHEIREGGAGRVAAALLWLALAGCAVNPATGREEFTGLASPAADRRLGAEQHPQVLADFGGALRDPRPAAYLAEVGARVARGPAGPDANFTLLDSPGINAFARPGSHFYVTRGLLTILNSEAELAGILCHEIAHVAARHEDSRGTRGMAVRLGTALFGVGLGDPHGGRGVGVGAASWPVSHSPAQEAEADALAIGCLARAGYDTRGLALALAALARADALDRALDAAEAAGYSAFHPDAPGRARRALALAGADETGQVGHESHQAALDGLAYGGYARRGQVRGRRFARLDPDFTFTAPPGYELRMGPDHVVIDGKDKAIAHFSTDRTGRTDMANYLVQDWGREMRFIAVERFQVAGRPAATGTARLRGEGGWADVRLVAIDWGGGLVFRFHMGSDFNGAGVIDRELRAMVDGLRPLSAADRRRWGPLRLRVVAVPAGATVESLAEGSPLGAEAPDVLRVINGLDAGQHPPPGGRFKLVVAEP